jgi:hypothetical protein
MLAAGLLMVGNQAVAAEKPAAPSTASVSVRTVKAQIWADNWFALYSGNTLVKQDSEPFETQRSFNAEIFSFPISLPAKMSIIIRDHLESDSGLEYIGTSHQMVGDGGFIAQFLDAQTNQVLAVSDSSWQCTVIHRAPLNRAECEHSRNPEQVCKSEIHPEPANWKSPDFDYSKWPHAAVYSEDEVRPHGEYNSLSWLPAAKLIWSKDLVVDNTLLCRFTIDAPQPGSHFALPARPTH